MILTEKDGPLVVSVIVVETEMIKINALVVGNTRHGINTGVLLEPIS